MQTDNRLLDDLSKLATGAAGAAQGLRQEIEAMVRQRVERVIYELDLVPREEFEAVKDMARKAREENDDLKKRIEALEAQANSSQSQSSARKTSAASAQKKTGQRSAKSRSSSGRSRSSSAQGARSGGKGGTDQSGDTGNTGQ